MRLLSISSAGQLVRDVLAVTDSPGVSSSLPSSNPLHVYHLGRSQIVLPLLPNLARLSRDKLHSGIDTLSQLLSPFSPLRALKAAFPFRDLGRCWEPRKKHPQPPRCGNPGSQEASSEISFPTSPGAAIMCLLRLHSRAAFFAKLQIAVPIVRCDYSQFSQITF